MTETSLTSADPFQVGEYLVEPSTLRVTSDGEEARLEAKAMLVLVYLVRHAGRVVGRSELEEHLWPGRIITEDSVTNAIAKLRRVFRDDARSPRVIETVPKRGYRLIAEVTPVGGAAVVAKPRSWWHISRWPAGSLVLALLLMAGWWMLQRGDVPDAPGRPVPDKPAVAVLAFENLGATPEQDYFANGITADLITDLSKLKGLLVLAPGSASTDQKAAAGAQAQDRRQGWDYVVVGSVQRLNERLRINVQLIDPEDERAIWGERYAGSMDEVFDLQDRLTAAVIAALQVELSPSEQASLAKRPTVSVLAYDHYLKGFEEHGHRSEAQNLLARNHFREAIDLDPEFALAYTGLALTYSRDAIDGWTATPAQSLELAAELAEKAASLDPSLPQVHFVTGQVKLFQGLHISALEAAERAIQVDPRYADAYALTAWALSYAGRPGEALAALEQGMHLNRRPPASYREILGEIRFVQGRYGDSAAAFQQVLDINPEYTRARMWNAAALALAGLEDRAEWEATELLVASPDFSLGRLGSAFPFKDPRMLERVIEGLRRAGLPD